MMSRWVYRGLSRDITNRVRSKILQMGRFRGNVKELGQLRKRILHRIE